MDEAFCNFVPLKDGVVFGEFNNIVNNIIISKELKFCDFTIGYLKLLNVLRKKFQTYLSEGDSANN